MVAVTGSESQAVPSQLPEWLLAQRPHCKQADAQQAGQVLERYTQRQLETSLPSCVPLQGQIRVHSAGVALLWQGDVAHCEEL